MYSIRDQRNPSPRNRVTWAHIYWGKETTIPYERSVQKRGDKKFLDVLSLSATLSLSIPAFSSLSFHGKLTPIGAKIELGKIG